MFIGRRTLSAAAPGGPGLGRTCRKVCKLCMRCRCRCRTPSGVGRTRLMGQTRAGNGNGIGIGGWGCRRDFVVGKQRGVGMRRLLVAMRCHLCRSSHEYTTSSGPYSIMSVMRSMNRPSLFGFRISNFGPRGRSRKRVDFATTGALEGWCAGIFCGEHSRPLSRFFLFSCGLSDCP